MLRTLRSRLLASHLAVVLIGLVVLVVSGRRLGSVFVDDHLRSMSRMMGRMLAGDALELERGITDAFNRALLWAGTLSAVAAAAAATFAATRVLEPLQGVRRVAQRLASGSYRERVPIPQEAELAELAADVNALAAALEETEARRLRLIAEVAHELRTPVATLKGYLEGLIDGVFQPDTETLGAAIGEAVRMERLAADLSALSRAEDGQVELRREAVDLNGLASDVAERLRPQFEGHEVELIVEPGQQLVVNVDRDRIAQVLINVIGNALSYTPRGGVVAVTTSKVDRTARVAVSDTGRGLSDDQLAMVFERFYRADRSAVGGTGIGLTIARSLARAHGGDLYAASQGLGQGSTFVLSLPLQPGGNPRIGQ